MLNNNTLVNWILAKNVKYILGKLLIDQEQKQKELCAEHSKALDYYCQDCHELVCSHCLVLDKKHPEHSMSTATAMSSQIKSKILDHNDKITNLRNTIQLKVDEWPELDKFLEHKIEMIRYESESKIRYFKEKVKSLLESNPFGLIFFL